MFWVTPLKIGAQDAEIIQMNTVRKITVEVSQKLLKRTQQATGAGVTQTVRTGLTLVAASQSYARLRKMRGKVYFSSSLSELKSGRE